MAEKIIPSPPKPNPTQSEVPSEKEEINSKMNNETMGSSGMLGEYVNVDFKFLTTIILMLCTIGAVVVYFPRVSRTSLFVIRDVNEYSNVRIFAFHANIRMRFLDLNIRIIFQPAILSCISLQEDSNLRPKVENNMTSHPACLLSNSRWSTF